MRDARMRQREFAPVFKGVIAEILFAAALGILGILICAITVQFTV